MLGSGHVHVMLAVLARLAVLVVTEGSPCQLGTHSRQFILKFVPGAESRSAC